MTQPDPFEELISELSDEWDRVERTRRGRDALWLVLTAAALLGLPVAVALEQTVLGIALFAAALAFLHRFLQPRRLRLRRPLGRPTRG